MLNLALPGTAGIWVPAIDLRLLSVLHDIALTDTGFLASACTLLGAVTEKGVVFLILGCAFLAFKGTRKAGCALIGAEVTAAFLAGALKELFARPRPFALGGEFEAWWRLVGSPAESGFSLPSGHASLAMAATLVLFLSFDKRVGILAFVGALLIGASRCYLMVHYPSDIASGFAVGILGAAAASSLVGRLYSKAVSAARKIARKGAAR